MPKRDVEAAVQRISQLRDLAHPAAEAAAELRKALLDRVNLIIAKAAQVASARQMRDLIPELLAAYDRLFVDAVNRDPQCWGKNAIAKALTELDHRESAPYLRGRRHIQLEAVWGGQDDTAQTLRGICTLALASCNDITRAEIFRHLVDSLADKSQVVRVEAVRAIEEMEGEEAALILRLKARLCVEAVRATGEFEPVLTVRTRLGELETPVAGQVLDSLLRIEREAALPLLAEFLGGPDGIREEAALALGSARMPAAVDLLIDALPRARGLYFRKTVLRALSASRQDKGLAFLFNLIREGNSTDADSAEEALKLHQESPEIQAAVEAAIKDRESPLRT